MTLIPTTKNQAVEPIRLSLNIIARNIHIKLIKLKIFIYFCSNLSKVFLLTMSMIEMGIPSKDDDDDDLFDPRKKKKNQTVEPIRNYKIIK